MPLKISNSGEDLIQCRRLVEWLRFLEIKYAFVGISVVVNKNKTDLQENLHNLFTLCWLIC